MYGGHLRPLSVDFDDDYNDDYYYGHGATLRYLFKNEEKQSEIELHRLTLDAVNILKLRSVIREKAT